ERRSPAMATTTDLAGLEAGLDALETTARVRVSLLTRVRRMLLPPLVSLVLIIAVWQIVWALHLKPDYLLPSPGETWDEATGSWSQWDVWTAMFNSIYRGLTGFAISLLI